MLISAADQPLPLSGAVALNEPSNPTLRLTTASPALQLMTDFKAERPIVVNPRRHIDAALTDMILEGVRALVVIDDGRVLGLIAASDVLGPRPVQFLQNPLCETSPCRHQDVRVGDIMTRWLDLKVLEFSWVTTATIGDVVDAFAQTDITHLLVVEGASSAVRGLFSRTRLARQLALS